MWKIVAFVGLIAFLVADSLYLYRRLKKYWQTASWKRPGNKNRKWRLGLSSLDMPLGKQQDTDRHGPEKK
jgi:hypothetical protein